MTTPTPEIWCINVLLDSPNGNVQLVYDNFLKANAMYDTFRNALENHDDKTLVLVEDSFGQKGALLVRTINSVLLNDTAASLRGGAEIGLLNDVAKIQYQNRAMKHPSVKAANMMRGFNGMGPANG